jgi:uncharacterized membrane protein YgcG
LKDAKIEIQHNNSSKKQSMAEDELIRSTRHEFVPLIHPADYKQHQHQSTTATTATTVMNKQVDEDDDEINTRVMIDEPLTNQKVVHVFNDYFDNHHNVDSETFHSIISDDDDDDEEYDEDEDTMSTGAETFKLNSVLTPAIRRPGVMHGPGQHEQQVVVQPLLEDPLLDRRVVEVIDDDEDEDLILIDIDPSVLALSSSSGDEDKNNYFRSIFDVPQTEKVVEEVYCAYYRKMPNQGRMYISQNFVCFISNIFGYKINLVIPFSNIAMIEKRNTALVVPTAIEILTRDSVVHFFGSFVFRDQTFKILEALRNLHEDAAVRRRALSEINSRHKLESDDESGKSDEESEDEQNHPLHEGAGNDSDESEEESEEESETEGEEEEENIEETEEATATVNDTEADMVDEDTDVGTAATVTTIEEDDTESESTFTEKNTDSEQEEPAVPSTSSSDNPSQESKETPVKSSNTLKVDTSFQSVSDLNSRSEHPLMGTTPRDGPPMFVFANKTSSDDASVTNTSGSSGKKRSDSNGKSNNGGGGGDKKGSSSGGGSSSNGGGGGDKDNNEDDDKKKKNTDTSTTDAEEEEEEEEDEDNSTYNITNFSEDDFTDMSQVPISDIFPPKDKFKPKDIVNENLPVSAKDFFFLITGDGAAFEQEHHITRGDTDFVVSPWGPATDNIGKVRDISFISPVNNPIGPKLTRVKMIQRLIVAKGQKEFMVQSNMASIDVPYAECFRIIIYIYVKDGSDPNTCNVRIELGVMFLKSTILKWKIEDSASKETTSSYLLWFNQAKQAVTKGKEQKVLFSQRSGSSGKGKKSSKQKEKGKGKSSKSSKKTASKKKKKASAPVITIAPVKPIQSTVPAVPVTTAYTSSSSEESTLTALVGQALNFILNLPETLNNSVSIPVWIVFLVFILFTLVIVPKQNRIISTLDHVQKDLQVYKLQTALFEVELNNILFNMSSYTDEKNKVQIRNRQDFELQLREWYKHKSEIYKSSIDNAVLHEILYQLEQLKRERREQPSYYKPSGHHLPTTPPTPLLSTDLHYQHMLQTSAHLSYLTWSIIGFLILLGVSVVLKMFVFT